MKSLALSVNKINFKSKVCYSISGGLLNTTDTNFLVSHERQSLLSLSSALHGPSISVKHCGRVWTRTLQGTAPLMATRKQWRQCRAYGCFPQDSSRACHLHTCCPLDSFIAVQCLSSSSPELFRPKEIQPIISFLFMLRLLYTDRMRVTSESWNKATWKTKVSLYTGFGCPLRVDVLHLDISWPMEFSSVNLTYVSEGKKPTHHKHHLKQTDNFLMINAKIR